MVRNNISVNDIGYMVNTCVKNILREYHHSIGYEYENTIDKLSSFIYHHFGVNVSVPLNMFNVNGKELKLQFESQPPDGDENTYGAYDSDSHILKIYKNCPKDIEYIKRVVTHELSHAVDKSKRTKTDFDTSDTVNAYSDNAKEFQVANTIMYLFRPTEIQARLSEYQSLLKSRPKLTTCYVFNQKNDILNNQKQYVLQKEVDNCLKLKDMYYYFNKLKNYDYTSGELDDGIDYTQVLLLIGSIRRDIFTNRMKEIGKPINQSKFDNGFNHKQFYKIKNNVIRLLHKRLNNMITKARKIKADAIYVN